MGGTNRNRTPVASDPFSAKVNLINTGLFCEGQMIKPEDTILNHYTHVPSERERRERSTKSAREIYSIVCCNMLYRNCLLLYCFSVVSIFAFVYVSVLIYLLNGLTQKHYFLSLSTSAEYIGQDPVLRLSG